MVKIHDIRYRTPNSNGKRKLSQVKNIARHHSATVTGEFDSFMRHWKGTRGWGTGGYHEIILRDGSVELCYSPENITNGVAGLNTTVYNICVVGNGSFTAEQEKTFDIRAKNAMKIFNLSVSDVKGHGSFPGSSTTCPGINMNDVRKRLEGGVVEQATNTKPVTPKPSKPVASKDTNSIVDYLNGLKVDSSAANRNKLAKEYGVKNYALTAAKNTELLNAMRKGKPVSKPIAKPKPPKVVRALKRGDKGAEVKEMQRLLVGAYFYPERNKLDRGVDGHFGVNTDDALRRFQKVHTPHEVDGLYGPKTKAALAKVSK